MTFSEIGYYDSLLDKAISKDNLEDRFEMLAGIADDLNEAEEVDQNSLQIATTIGALDVVGDEMATSLEDVLDQLSRYTNDTLWQHKDHAEVFEDFISHNSDLNFQHHAYYALQQIYIWEIWHRMSTVDSSKKYTLKAPSE